MDHIFGYIPDENTRLNNLHNNGVNVNWPYLTKRNSKPLYACFVDFKSAFDTVWHQGLLYKLKAAEVGTKLYNIIQNMYSKTEVCVKIDNYRTDFFFSVVDKRTTSSAYMRKCICVLFIVTGSQEASK
jgi:hypothetical protein